MKNTEKIFKTIHSVDIYKFDELILKHLKIGWTKIDGSYSYSWKNLHSQILELDSSNYNYIKTFENGSTKVLGNMQNQQKVGTWYSFDMDGNFHQEANFKDGKEHGEWIYYHSDGSIKKKEVYKKGELIKFIKDDEEIEFKK